MRLGQISRKLNIRPIQIRDFIRDKFQVEIDTDLNTKLEDNYIEALQKKFDTAPKVDLFAQETQLISPKKELIENIEEDRWSIKAAALIKAKKAEATKSNVEETFTDVVIDKVEILAPIVIEEKVDTKIELTQEKSENVITTEEITADGFDPFTPRRVDPDAVLIKAVNVKLEGPKVVGKIVLPPSKKELEAADAEARSREAELVAAAIAVAETDASLEVSVDGLAENETILETSINLDPEPKTKSIKSDPISKKIATMQGDDSDEEWSPFKDKNGIYHFSREQKQNRQKSLAHLKLGKKDEQKKRAKSSYYQQNFKPEPKELVAKNKEKKETISKKSKAPETVVRKGVWGKFVNWLNG